MARTSSKSSKQLSRESEFAITVGELREEIEGVPDDQELSPDPEGNRYWSADDAFADQLWMEYDLVHPEDFEDLSREKVKLVTHIALRHTTP